MKILLEFKDTPAGDIEFKAEVTEEPNSQLQEAYLKATVELMLDHIPLIGKRLGAKGAIVQDIKAKPRNQ